MDPPTPANFKFYESEKCFRRYEAIIAQALTAFPNPIRFRSKTRSPTTDAARCTNAINAYSRHKWPTTDPVFAYIEDRKLRVWPDRGHCVVGPAVTQAIELLAVDTAGNIRALQVNPDNDEDVNHLVDLVDRCVLQEPLEFKLEWGHALTKACEGRLNVTLRIEPTTIILF